MWHLNGRSPKSQKKNNKKNQVENNLRDRKNGKTLEHIRISRNHIIIEIHDILKKNSHPGSCYLISSQQPVIKASNCVKMATN